jgi:hypothetical protein
VYCWTPAGNIARIAKLMFGNAWRQWADSLGEIVTSRHRKWQCRRASAAMQTSANNLSNSHPNDLGDHHSVSPPHPQLSQNPGDTIERRPLPPERLRYDSSGGRIRRRAVGRGGHHLCPNRRITPSLITLVINPVHHWFGRSRPRIGALAKINSMSVGRTANR